jgi:hypothetical protein
MMQDVAVLMRPRYAWRTLMRPAVVAVRPALVWWRTTLEMREMRRIGLLVVT